MWKQLKGLLAINKTDLLFVVGLSAGPWLLVHLVTAGVMLLLRPDESIMIAGMMQPFCVGLAAFAVASGNGQITFPQAVRFGRTRKRALGLTLSLAGLESLAGIVLGLLLLLFERQCAMPLWRVLSGNPGLLVDDFGFLWWTVPAGAAVGYLIGLWYGTMVLRYSKKGFWAFYFLCIGGPAVFQMLPWKTHEVTNILIPVLVVLAVLAAVWSLRTMLKLTITK